MIGVGVGGFSTFPLSFGATKNNIHEVILASLLQSQGSALDTDPDGLMYAECYAKALVLTDLWSAVQRLRNQEHPETMTDFLPEWEKIFHIVPPMGSTLAQRRAILATRFANFGKAPTIQVVTDLMAAILGDVFVKILYGSDVINDGSIYDGYAGIEGSVPGGANIPGGFDFINTVPDITTSTPASPKSFNQQNWNSTMAYLLIVVQQPANMTNQTFLNIVAQIDPALEDLLPAWTTFGWAEYNIFDTGGFILDTQNLDGGCFFEP